MEHTTRFRPGRASDMPRLSSARLPDLPFDTSIGKPVRTSDSGTRASDDDDYDNDEVSANGGRHPKMPRTKRRRAKSVTPRARC